MRSSARQCRPVVNMTRLRACSSVLLPMPLETTCTSAHINTAVRHRADSCTTMRYRLLNPILTLTLIRILTRTQVTFSTSHALTVCRYPVPPSLPSARALDFLSAATTPPVHVPQFQGEHRMLIRAVVVVVPFQMLVCFLRASRCTGDLTANPYSNPQMLAMVQMVTEQVTRSMMGQPQSSMCLTHACAYGYVTDLPVMQALPPLPTHPSSSPSQSFAQYQAASPERALPSPMRHQSPMATNSSPHSNAQSHSNAALVHSQQNRRSRSPTPQTQLSLANSPQSLLSRSASPSPPRVNIDSSNSSPSMSGMAARDSEGMLLEPGDLSEIMHSSAPSAGSLPPQFALDNQANTPPQSPRAVHQQPDAAPTPMSVDEHQPPVSSVAQLVQPSASSVAPMVVDQHAGAITNSSAQATAESEPPDSKQSPPPNSGPVSVRVEKPRGGRKRRYVARIESKATSSSSSAPIDVIDVTDDSPEQRARHLNITRVKLDEGKITPSTVPIWANASINDLVRLLCFTVSLKLRSPVL
jgi:hypothetical protein